MSRSLGARLERNNLRRPTWLVYLGHRPTQRIRQTSARLIKHEAWVVRTAHGRLDFHIKLHDIACVKKRIAPKYVISGIQKRQIALIFTPNNRFAV
ncbi:hypothetical protein [Roseobacter sp.]|uniref:hypothetical protein n=1 Tax=Roseobacter sp. TaxID=1907202 RepID=UPI003297A20E